MSWSNLTLATLGQHNKPLPPPASKNKLRFKSDIYLANAVDINQESNPAVIEMTILLLASPRKLGLDTEENYTILIYY